MGDIGPIRRIIEVIPEGDPVLPAPRDPVPEPARREEQPAR